MPPRRDSDEVLNREPPRSRLTQGSYAATKAAGGVLTAKQAPHRPGTAPALGLRAGEAAAAILSQAACFKEQLS
jgi:hypothetical protein